MTAALRAEVRKLRTTRSLAALPVGGFVVAFAGTVLLLAFAKPHEIGNHLSRYGPLRFGPTDFGLLIALFGVRVFADESHHHTLAATLLRIPSRRRILAAKAALAAVTGAAFCAAVYLTVIPATVMGTAIRGHAMSYDAVATLLLFCRATMAMMLLAVIGVLIGAASRNRTVALVAVVAWFGVLENMIAAVTTVDRFLPGAAIETFISPVRSPAMSPVVAALVLVALAAAAAVAACVVLGRDVA